MLEHENFVAQRLYGTKYALLDVWQKRVVDRVVDNFYTKESK